MRPASSLRFRLMVFYLFIVIGPVLIITIAMPYYYHSSITRETRALTEATLTSLGRNIETYLDDLERLTIAPYLDAEVMRALRLKASPGYAGTDEYARLVADRALSSSLHLFLQNTRRDILGTLLVAADGSAYLTSAVNAQSVPDYAYAAQPWYKNAVAADGRVIFIGAHPQDYLASSPQPQVFSVARLIVDPNSRKHLAVIMADADTNVLDQIASNLDFGVSSIVCLFDGDNKLVYVNAPLPASPQNQTWQNQAEVQLGGESYITISRPVLPAEWNLVVLLSNDEIRAKTRWLYVVGGLFAVGGLLLTVVLFGILSRWIVNPFRDMIAVMKRVQHGDLSSRFVVTGNDEIAELGTNLNDMVAQLSHLIDREYKAVLDQRNAEYRALQSQIRPHFLYNTLNGFVGLNRLGDAHGLEKAILALSGMLRYTFDQQDWVRLEDEFLFVRRYCDLQHIRFRERLELSICCDGAVADVPVPKLLLQPLVENAVIHGIEPLSRSCRLTVMAVPVQRHGHAAVRISIGDDGQGFDSELNGETSGRGIANVRERLKMAFADADLTIATQAGVGTTVTIEFPVRGLCGSDHSSEENDGESSDRG